MKHFYILKAFNQNSIQGWEDYRALQNSGSTDAWEKWKNSDSRIFWLTGATDHAFFTSLKAAKDYVKEVPTWIAEGNYYTILLILRKGFGSQDAAISWPYDKGVETWYLYNNQENIYEEIDRPKWAIGTCF